MKRSLLLPFAMALVAVLLLRESVYRRDWPVGVSYSYPAVVTRLDIAAEDASEESPEVVFPLDLNLATPEELIHVPRIGEVLSARIVEYREVIGGYTELYQLTQIRGISENTLRAIEPYLTVVQSQITA